jgi:hypothetical protein
VIVACAVVTVALRVEIVPIGATVTVDALRTLFDRSFGSSFRVAKKFARPFAASCPRETSSLGASNEFAGAEGPFSTAITRVTTAVKSGSTPVRSRSTLLVLRSGAKSDLATGQSFGSRCGFFFLG